MVKYTVEFEDDDIVTCCNLCKFIEYGYSNGELTCLFTGKLLGDITKLPTTCPLKLRED